MWTLRPTAPLPPILHTQMLPSTCTHAAVVLLFRLVGGVSPSAPLFPGMRRGRREIYQIADGSVVGLASSEFGIVGGSLLCAKRGQQQHYFRVHSRSVGCCRLWAPFFQKRGFPGVRGAPPAAPPTSHFLRPGAASVGPYHQNTRDLSYRARRLGLLGWCPTCYLLGFKCSRRVNLVLE